MFNADDVTDQYVDIAARTYEAVPTGNGHNEEPAIDDSGEVGILTYGPAGNAVTFSVADPLGGLGATLGLTGDAAGVAFFPGSKRAFMLQAPTVLTGNIGGHNVRIRRSRATTCALRPPRCGIRSPACRRAIRSRIRLRSTVSYR